MTNNLKVRLEQHHQNIIRGNKTFASKYNIEFLVYYEKFTWLQLAIVREKKLNLIRSFNANFEFLNGRFAGPDVIPPASE
ncbi:GIY-YIG nuclease family protein [Flavobacterium acetivorans]|uniref:GIY-YIG nuclease family protein n=1 Tax=Flavobacterium acetivorans TaxID=2893883 RepID=UPI003204A830